MINSPILLVSLLTIMFTIADASVCNIHWLHVPKTSSTFCLSMQHACDEDRFFVVANQTVKEIRLQHSCALIHPNGFVYGAHGHSPISWENYPILENVVTILRKPLERLVSAFDDSLHSEGMSLALRSDLQGRFKQPYRNLTNVDEICSHNFGVWNSHSANHGCITKMLNGFHCHEHIDLTQNHLDTALGLIQKFLFVGIVEEYEASVNTFLKVVQNRTLTHNAAIKADMEAHLDSTKPELYREVHLPPHSVELGSYRRHAERCGKHIYKALNTSTLNYEDKYDTIVYEAAVKRFHHLKSIFGPEE